MEWISVKDRLPKNNETVLAYAVDYHYEAFIARYNKGEWFDDEIAHNPKIDDYVSHWIPIPKLPKRH